MYLLKYVKKFGNYSFKERPFNDVDATILSTIVYSNFEVVAPSILDTATNPICFKDISSFDMDIVVAGRILMKGNKKMFPLLCKSNRFKDISVRYIQKVLMREADNQFYACTFDIPDVGTFISFRGTDSSIIGWKEDLIQSIRKAVLSQLDATEYLNLIGHRVTGPLYVGGHSKGGNEVLYSVLHCEQAVRDRIVKAYSFDGNGLKTDDFLSSKEYKEIENRFIFVRPQNSFVGQIMHNPPSNYIVKSKAIGVFQHDVYTWKINKNSGEFIRLKSMKKKAILRQLVFVNLLKQVSKEQTILLIEFFVRIFGGLDKTIFHFLFSFGKVYRLIKAYRSFSKKERVQIKECLQVAKKSKKDAIQSLKQNKKHD